VKLRIARRHRQTVTDKSQFWVARPTVTGALFTGFSIADVSALLTPYVSYYADPGQGVIVQDGWRVAASSSRPSIEPAAVPADALKQTPPPSAPPASDDLVMVRITYAAIERDTFSADDPVHAEGTGTLFLDRSGRAVVITARSLVDGFYFVTDGWGDPEIEDEQIKVLLGNGTVLRAGRVWVDPGGADLAVLLLENAPHDLIGTPAKKLHFAGAVAAPPASLAIRRAGPDATALPPMALGTDVVVSLDEALGAAVTAADQVIGIYGRKTPHGTVPTVTAIELLPTDLRPN